MESKKLFFLRGTFGDLPIDIDTKVLVICVENEENNPRVNVGKQTTHMDPRGCLWVVFK